MNKQELINVPRILFPVGTEVLIKGKIVGLKVLDDRFVENVVKLDYGEQIIDPNDAIYVKDEPETGHADEAPRYLKNILARLRELPLHNREVWLKVIMSEFKQDFSHAKWREGYEQGKLEGMVEREKVKVPQCVADVIEGARKKSPELEDALHYTWGNGTKEFTEWYNKKSNRDLFARAWIFGYEVEKERRYFVKAKSIGDHNNYLKYNTNQKHWYFGSRFIYVNDVDTKIHHTRKELEETGFGWVFDCPGIEIEEVE